MDSIIHDVWENKELSITIHNIFSEPKIFQMSLKIIGSAEIPLIIFQKQSGKSIECSILTPSCHKSLEKDLIQCATNVII